MKYLAKSFSSRPSTKAYRDNFDRTFRTPTKASPGQGRCDYCFDASAPCLRCQEASARPRMKLHKWRDIRDKKNPRKEPSK